MSSNFKQLLESAHLLDPTLRQDTPTWELWKAQETTTTGPLQKHFLYLKHGASFVKSAQEVRQLNIAKESLHAILYPANALLKDKERIRKDFGVATVHNTFQFLQRPHEMVLRAAQKRMVGDRIADLEKGVFVDPPFSPPLAKPLDFLSTWLFADPATQSTDNLIVLLADGGQGKTWLSRHLELKMWQQWEPERPVPIRLDNKLWRDIDSNHGLTIDDIIQRALIDRGLSALSGLPDINTYWAQGLWAIILDGFDELCAHRTGVLKPERLLREILSRSESNPTSRLILTSRTSYWNQHIGSEALGDGAKCLQMTGFGLGQRGHYFNEELKRQKLIKEATSLAKHIDRACYGVQPQPGPSKRLTGVPYILKLIADLVRSRVATALSAEEIGEMEADPLLGLLGFVCRRESIRHGLDATHDDQLAALQEIAVTLGERFTGEEIDMCCHETAPAHFQDQVQLDRMRNHILLRALSRDSYEFALPMLREQLQAVAVSQAWAHKKVRAEHDAILALNARGDTVFLEKLAERTQCAQDSWKEILQESFNRVKRGNQNLGTSALWHLAEMVCGKASRPIRTDAMLKIFANPGTRSLTEMCFVGRIDGFDFRNVVFDRCHFDSCEILASDFSGATFVNCFLNGEVNFGKDCQKVAAIKVSYDSGIKPNSISVLNLVGAGVKQAFRLVDQRIVEMAVTNVLSPMVPGGLFGPLDKTRFTRQTEHGGDLYSKIVKGLRAAGILMFVKLDGNRSESVLVPDIEQPAVRDFLESGSAFGSLRRVVTEVTKAWSEQEK